MGLLYHCGTMNVVVCREKPCVAGVHACVSLGRNVCWVILCRFTNFVFVNTSFRGCVCYSNVYVCMGVQACTVCVYQCAYVHMYM